MSCYLHFIPEFVLCTNSSLFWFRIANKLSEFRNYLSINIYIHQNHSLCNNLSALISRFQDPAMLSISPVYTFHLYPHSNLSVGTFFQQLPESIYDCRFCMVHINQLTFSFLYHSIKSRR